MARELPNSQNLEQSLLGSLMVYPSIMQSCMDQGLDYEEFYLPIHQKIYAVIQELQGTGKPIDLNNVIARLQDKNELEQAGGSDYIIQLMDSAISPVNTNSYIESIKTKPKCDS